MTQHDEERHEIKSEYSCKLYHTSCTIFVDVVPSQNGVFEAMRMKLAEKNKNDFFH